MTDTRKVCSGAEGGGIDVPRQKGPAMTDGARSQDSHDSKTDAEPPGDSQVTNPNRMIGDGDEVSDND